MPSAYNPIETYLQEAEELLAETEQCALALNSDTAGDETVHQLFRAFHTIKGSGAMCGLDRVAAFTHHVETLLEKVRGGAVVRGPRLGSLILEACDHIRALLAAENGSDPPLPGASEDLIAAFNGFTACGQHVHPPVAPSEAVSVVSFFSGAIAEWSIEFRPDPGLLACGNNPALIFRELSKLGPCRVAAHAGDVPELDDLRPDACYLWWTIGLHTGAGRDAIRDAFIFVEEGSRIRIEQVVGQTADAAAKPCPEGPDSRGIETPVEARKLARESTVRVPSARLDRLVNLVGELVMTQSRLTRAAAHSAVPEFANPVQELERLVAELRDDVLGIRMLPIGTIFGRFRRVVHDVTAELAKEADLITTGAATELDKSILDQIAEPLVHLLRNAIDHGIETPGEREAAGKPRRGTIRLAAEHAGSAVVVSIEDDGRGIDRAAVRAKAVDRQVISPDASLTDKEILNLVLLPGLSTARTVTSLSGRGVGMDVVKRHLDALRGSVAISSEPGNGTRIALTLPLTLAIIEGLLVSLGADQVIVPMAAVLENVELCRADRKRHNGRNVVAVRGELVPYIDLRAVFETSGEAPEVQRIVIVRHEDQRVGLVVDRVVGTHQTVIQSLGRFFRSADVVSGATIMGDGRVAVILDVGAVVRHVDRGPANGLAVSSAALQ
jgi:two-component system chemotaxis sensor kinase CheA